jgi:hypothetical protein
MFSVVVLFCLCVRDEEKRLSPDEAAVARLLGVVGSHVDALVVPESINVEMSLELRNLKLKKLFSF